MDRRQVLALMPAGVLVALSEMKGVSAASPHCCQTTKDREACLNSGGVCSHTVDACLRCPEYFLIGSDDQCHCKWQGNGKRQKNKRQKNCKSIRVMPAEQYCP